MQKILRPYHSPLVCYGLFSWWCGFSFSPTVTTDNPGGQVTHLYYGASGLAESRDIRPGGRGQAYYHQPNWRGDTALLTNQSGRSAHEYFYTSYGELLDNNSQLQDSSNFTGPHNRFTLSGKELDAESGLTYFGVRHYDAARGNWTTADPLRGPLNDPLQRNRYLFNRSCQKPGDNAPAMFTQNAPAMFTQSVPVMFTQNAPPG